MVEGMVNRRNSHRRKGSVGSCNSGRRWRLISSMKELGTWILKVFPARQAGTCMETHHTTPEESCQSENKNEKKAPKGLKGWTGGEAGQTKKEARTTPAREKG